MLRKAFLTIIVMTMVVALGGGAAGSAQAAETPACSAEQGQLLIDEGRYKQAIQEFSCLIAAQPTEVEGYQGRIEAKLLLGLYSDAYQDYARLTALVLPVHPDAEATILAGYDARLATAPQDIPALTGASFARWWAFDYSRAVQLLDQLLDIQPDNLFGHLFRGSSRILMGSAAADGAENIERAIVLAPKSPDVRYIIADAYLYGRYDYTRAFAEASLALDWGLDTPRVHAILAAAYNYFGDRLAAAAHIQRHLELVTAELVPSSPLTAGSTQSLDILPGQTYDIPVPAIAGETISIITRSNDFYDTILLLLAPDGSLVIGSDDYRGYFAGIQLPAEQTGSYRLLVTTFEAVSSGELVVARK